jgi:hypothetical protein
MKMMILVNEDFKKALVSLSKQPLPLKAAFKMKSIIKKVDEEQAKYDECRKEALERLGEKGEDGKLIVENGIVKMSAENLAKFAKEVQVFQDEEVDFSKLKLSELGEDVLLTTQEMLLLDHIIMED